MSRLGVDFTTQTRYLLERRFTEQTRYFWQMSFRAFYQFLWAASHGKKAYPN